MTEPVDRRALSELLTGPVSDAVMAGEAAVEPVAVPGLPEGSVWEVSVPEEPHMPRLIVGRGPGGRLRLLTGRPDAFRELIADLPVVIADADTAVGYVRAFLAITREHDVLVQVPDHADAIQWRPGSPEEEDRRQAFVAEVSLEPQVRPREAADGFVVSLVLLRDQRAEQPTFTVGAGGSIDVDSEILVDGLPLPVLR